MSRPLVGLDIGYFHVRAVAVQARKGVIRVLGTAEVSRFDEQGERKPLLRALAEIDNKLSLRGRVGVVCSDLATMVRFEYNDPIPPDKLERLLHLELTQHTGGGEDLAADVHLVPLGSRELIHCCALAQVPQVHALLQDLRAAGIACDHLELPAAAVANAPTTEPLGGGGETAYELVVDIGSRATRIALLRDGDFLACRQIAYGGDNFTEQMARSRGIRFDEAEMLKRSSEALAPAESLASRSDESPIGAGGAVDEDVILFDEPEPEATSGDAAAPEVTASSEPTAPASAPGADEFDLRFEDEDEDAGAAADAGAGVTGDGTAPAPPHPAAVSGTGAQRESGEPWQRPTHPVFAAPEPPGPGEATLQVGALRLGPELTQSAEALHVQIAKTLSWFRAQLRLGEMDIARVRLLGGCADLVGLAGYLERRLKAPVVTGDPFAGCTGPTPERPHTYGLALGTALAGEPDTVSFDLRPESLLKRKAMMHELAWPWIAAALLVVATAVAGVAMYRRQSALQANIDTYQTYQQAHANLKQTFEQRQREYHGLIADFREIASRLYGGRDLLYTIRVLKERADAHRELWLSRLETEIVHGEDQSSRRTARTARRGRGRRTPRPPRPTGANDWSPIHRGSVLVSGFVRPSSDKTTLDLVGELQDWRESILLWRRPTNNRPLFQGAERDYPDSRLSDPEGGQRVANEKFEFRMRFRFQPTRLVPDEEEG
ncbi:MAG: pilus assembly protein PilM [Planctomycetota bacterium]